MDVTLSLMDRIERRTKAEELEKDLSHVEKMKVDLEQIVAVFNEKYHGRITEVFNCNYFLKDNNGMQFR